MTDTPSMRADWLQADAEDHPTKRQASKLRDGYRDLTMRSGASIEPGNATVNLATARDGPAVQLRPLRRHGRNAKLILGVTLRLDARSAGIYSRPEVRRRGRRRRPVEAEVSSNEYRDV
jgi:hypothetical protein